MDCICFGDYYRILCRIVLTYAEVVEMQKLVASEAAAGSWFGSAVATDGGIMVIGAYLHGEQGTCNVTFCILSH